MLLRCLALGAAHGSVHQRLGFGSAGAAVDAEKEDLRALGLGIAAAHAAKPSIEPSIEPSTRFGPTSRIRQSASHATGPLQHGRWRRARTGQYSTFC
jgi:hypothetical protein